MRVQLFAAVLLLAIGTASRAEAAVNSVDIGINPTYQQTGPTTVVSTGGFFAARAFLDSAGDFDGGMLSWPGATSPQALTPQAGPILGYSVGYGSFADLNAAFPPGTYTLTATNSATAASQTDTIDYSMAADPLSVPALTAASFTALQGLDVSSGFTLNFDTFAQNPDADQSFVFLNVFDATGNSAFSQGFLDPSTTSVFLPANTLMAGQSYVFDLVFDSRITGSDGTVPTTIFFDAHTDGSFTTAAAAVPEPATWAMMIGGFGMTGAALRRKRAPVFA